MALDTMRNFASMLLAESLVITNLLPLVTLGGSSERKIIIGTPNFSAGVNPKLLKSLKTQLETQQPGIHQAQSLRTCT